MVEGLVHINLYDCSMLPQFAMIFFLVEDILLHAVMFDLFIQFKESNTGNPEFVVNIFVFANVLTSQIFAIFESLFAVGSCATARSGCCYELEMLIYLFTFLNHSSLA